MPIGLLYFYLLISIFSCTAIIILVLVRAKTFPTTANQAMNGVVAITDLKRWGDGKVNASDGPLDPMQAFVFPVDKTLNAKLSVTLTKIYQVPIVTLFTSIWIGFTTVDAC